MHEGSSIVGRVVIDDEEFETFVRLTEDAFDRIPEITSTAVRRYDDAHEGHGAGI
jgi:hypothetical protein